MAKMKENLEELSLSEKEVIGIFIESEIREDDRKIRKELPNLEKKIAGKLYTAYNLHSLYPILQTTISIDLYDKNYDRLMKNLLKYMMRCSVKGVIAWKALNTLYCDIHSRVNQDSTSDKYDLARNLTARNLMDGSNNQAEHKKINDVLNDFIYKNKFSEERARKL
ncbi:MAG: hypothetical protein AB1571_00735 [Nanoarchaeota archaeon]